MSIDTILFFCLICACVAGVIADKKGQRFLTYFVLGFGLNIFGVLMAWSAKDARKDREARP